MHFFLTFALLLISISGSAIANEKSPQKQKMKLKRVILAVNDSPIYLAFWPYAAKAWSEIVGIRPTLALVADENTQVDESLGDVIRFTPVENLDTAFQAQIIRLLLPALFPDEVCIISDIDQVPASRSYFCDSITNFNEDSFVVYKELISRFAPDEICMCYNAAKGSTFGEIFKVSASLKSIRNRITELGKTAYPLWLWKTDQKVLFQKLTSWSGYKTRCHRLGEDWVAHKLYAYDWPQARPRLQKGWYYDVQLGKPYSNFQKYNEEVLRELNLLN